MKRLFPLLVAVLLIGCKDTHTVLVDYEAVRLSPLMYKFINYSHGCDSYKWDFGDGTWSNATDYALKEFATTGTYTVTLIGSSDGNKYEYQQRINVTVPDCYISGYTLYHIPYENQYYKLIFKDDNLLPSSWDFNTGYTPLLTSDDLPYTRVLVNPKLLSDIDSHDHYTVQVMRTTNAANTSGDKQCLKQTIKVKDIKTYQPEYILSTETDATTVGILMDYTW